MHFPWKVFPVAVSRQMIKIAASDQLFCPFRAHDKKLLQVFRQFLKKVLCAVTPNGVNENETDLDRGERANERDRERNSVCV
jgi:hypothetical protein